VSVSQKDKVVRQEANFNPDPNLCEPVNIVVMKYVLEGKPEALARPRFGLGHIYDSQKRLKQAVIFQLRRQHFLPLFTGPLRMDVVFYMPIPQRLKKKIKSSAEAPQYVKPDADNLLKFLCDCCNKIIYEDDAQLATIMVRKLYSVCPRTEFSITTLNPNGE